MTKQLAFSYPRRGLTGQFNTFRLGKKLGESLKPGDEVQLVGARDAKPLGCATVVSVHTGPLNELAPLHAHQAHNWKEHPPEQRAALLVASMRKRYPPGRVHDTSICTVVYLQEKTP